MEEQACLVHARSDSESSSKLGSFGSLSRTMTYTDTRLSVNSGTEGSGEPGNTTTMTNIPPENPEGNESGELLDYNDSSVLEQFHEDALRQAGCGLYQIRVYLAVGFAIAGASLELASIAFVLPSAEIELCIQPHEKNWLVLISIMGWSLGAVGWGALAERGGRRRALHSALAVNAVFAAIAAFMPTYGTFMMARFCSAIGSGGVMPAGLAYAGESAARPARVPLAAALPGCLGAGVLLAAGLARAVLPPTGADALVDSKEHFSAWHRYLLLCTIPILASLISLVWTHESPRYLLEMGRDVDAMMVYQSIHSGNQTRVCGVSHTTEYRLGELALPGKRRAPALHHFWQAFFQLFSTTYRSTTLSLTGMLLCTVAIQFFLLAYIPAVVVKMENEEYELTRKTIENVTYEHVSYNETLENMDFVEVTFKNCTFRDILMSHVEFVNCTFYNSALSNIKTSYTTFRDTTFVNSTIIDTDMQINRELLSCTLIASSVRGMNSACRPDVRWVLRPAVLRRLCAAHGALLAALPTGVRRAHVPRVYVAMNIISAVLAPALYVARSQVALYLIEAAYALINTFIFFSVAIRIMDVYPAHLRCTVHGLALSAAYLAGAAARTAGGLPPASVAIVAALALAAAAAGRHA
ncbi:unnamed protein product, partial [Brenthis ino]